MRDSDPTRTADHGGVSRRQTSRGRSRRNGASSPTNWKRHGTALPSWADLEPKTNQRVQEPSDDASFLQRISTVRFGLILLGLAAAFTLYVGHVHATQQLAMDVQQARAANHTLHLKHNRLKGEFDRKTGPSVIYERARAIGLQERLPNSPTITVP